VPALNEDWWWICRVAEFHLKHARSGDVWTAMLYMTVEALGEDPYDLV
jgi:hypothetical protein